MAKTKAATKVPASFINSLKDRIPIHEFYTKLTGIPFVNDNSRLRAKVKWRIDDHPSLCYFSRNNTLTDFADQSNYSNKIGKVYNHLDLLLVTKTCKTYYDAIIYLANYVGELIPADLMKTIQHFTKRQEALADVYTACRDTMNSMFLDTTDKRTSELLRAYCKVRCLPFERNFFDLLEIGLYPAKSIVDAICKKYELDPTKDDEISFAKFTEDFENKALVFPLHNKHGILSGITIRTMTDKKSIRQSLLNHDNLAMYGIHYALSTENHKAVAIAEGEMCRVAVAAALWNKPDVAATAIRRMFCTGSLGNNNKLKQLEGELNKVFYFPDVKLKDPDKESLPETVDNVLEVYNNIKPLEFRTVYWENQQDTYDLDDYLREHSESKERYSAYMDIFRLRSLHKTMPEFIYATIEQLVREFSPESRDSARYGYCERFAERLFNGADQNKLRALYKHITHVDSDVIEDIQEAVFTRIGTSNYFTKNHCYFIEEDDKSGNKIKTQISDFIIRGKNKMVSMMYRSKPKSEEIDQCWENNEFYAELSQKGKREKKNIIFKTEDLVDGKKFWNNVYGVDINLTGGVIDKRLDDVFFCIKNTLPTKIEKFSFTTPGPHIKSFAPEILSETLRPSLFVQGGTLNTYLNKHVSVIDGKVVENKSIGVDLSKAGYYKFSTCDNETLSQISHILWYKLRKLHVPSVIDGLIGYSFSTPIKHILMPNVNGLHLFLLGPSNSHKTSIARIFQNFFGDFATDDRVQAFVNQTPKHLENAIQATGNSICVCDEFKPSKVYTIEMMNHLIHNIFNGKSFGRLNTKGEPVDINFFTANVITTAEYTQDFETSAEARYIRFIVPPINTKEIFEELNSSTVLPLFKCFTPYLIAWQHRHIDLLKTKYQEYYNAIEDVIKSEPNCGRIAMQLSMMIVGFYSFCKFIEDQSICSEEEADAAIQKLLLHFLGEAKIQLARSKETRAFEKFLEFLAAGIDTKRFNMATLTYDGNDKLKTPPLYSQPNNTIANIWKYRKNSKDDQSYVYAILNLKTLIIDIKRNFEMTFADSLKDELAENKLVVLDESRSIQGVKIPDPQNPTQMKTKRAVIIPESILFPEGPSDDREPDGF